MKIALFFYLCLLLSTFFPFLPKQEYDIKAENNIKEVVGSMCNLSQGIKEDGIRIGKEDGILKKIPRCFYTAGF